MAGYAENGMPDRLTLPASVADQPILTGTGVLQ